MSVLRYTRADLLEALESRRAWAVAYDAANLAQHKKDEAKALKEFRDKLRVALKWDYQTAKHEGNYRGRLYLESTRCPESAVATLDRQLAIISATRQKNFVVQDKGAWSRLFWVLTHDESITTEMC